MLKPFSEYEFVYYDERMWLNLLGSYTANLNKILGGGTKNEPPAPITINDSNGGSGPHK
jgi:hypothetical protein